MLDNNITQFMPSANTVINGTDYNHIFNDGYIMREIKVDASGNVTILTIGEGVNKPLPLAAAFVSPVLLLPGVSASTAAEFNQLIGHQLFLNVGVENLNHVREALKPKLP